MVQFTQFSQKKYIKITRFAKTSGFFSWVSSVSCWFPLAPGVGRLMLLSKGVRGGGAGVLCKFMGFIYCNYVCVLYILYIHNIYIYRYRYRYRYILYTWYRFIVFVLMLYELRFMRYSTSWISWPWWSPFWATRQLVSRSKVATPS